MEYTKLGTSPLEVSRLCVGCMSFGDPASKMHEWTLNAEESELIIAHALELGINFFDTANTYSAGTSEQYLSKALKKHTSRDKVIIATKVFFNEGKLTKKAINREIDASLKRLESDYVDLYIIHRCDKDTPPEETMEALHGLVKAGKVRALGASAMFGYQFAEYQNAAEKNGFTPFVSMQNHYNLIYREDEREMIPICAKQGVSLTPYSPLAAGRLCRTEWKTDTKRSRTDASGAGKYDYMQDADSVIVARVHELAERHGTTMTQIALAWLFKKGVASAIIGATKMSHFSDAAGALNVSLTDEEIAYLEEKYLPHKVVGAYL